MWKWLDVDCVYLFDDGIVGVLYWLIEVIVVGLGFDGKWW